MKKILNTLICVLFITNVVFADEVFTSLTKYDEDMEKMPVNVTIISSKDIENSNADTVEELLKQESGFYVKTNGGTGSAVSIFIRGASSVQTLVLIDGRRVNDTGLGSANLNSIQLSSIERIEIIRGAGAAVYGTSAFGGVVNIITKKAVYEGVTAEAGLSYGSFNTYSDSITGAYKKSIFGGLITFSNLRSDGYRKNSAYDGKNIFGSFQMYMGNHSIVSLTASAYNSTCGVPGPDTIYVTPFNEQKDDNKYLKLDYTLKVLNNSHINASGYISQNIRNYYDATGNPHDPLWALTEGRYKYNSETYGTQIDFHYENIILAGAEFWEDTYKEVESLSGYNASKGRSSIAGYAQGNIYVENLTIIPSVRYDNNSQFGGFFTPAISLVYNFTNSIKASGNIGRVWRSPSFSDLYWSQPGYLMHGNPDLKPEKGVSADLGVEYQYDKLRFMGSYFHIVSEDLISWAQNSNTNEWYSENINKAKQYGFEFEVGFYMASWLNHSLNYTYLKAEDEKTGKTLTYKPENTVNYTLTIKPVKSLSLAASIAYKNQTYINAVNTKKLDDTVICNININYKATENLNLWVKGLNIGNVKYEFEENYPMPGATVYGGVNLKVF